MLILFLDHIKKLRYSGQVIAPVLGALLRDAYQEAKAAGDEDFDKWCKGQKDESFMYFFGVLKHLLNVNLFVRSLREASFELFVASLEQLCPLLFSLYHIHYSRWIPVFNHELKLLKVSDPTLYHSFSMGHFVARKTDTDFSKIAFDQAHEQNNKIVKSRAGVSSLLNKEYTTFLRKMENVLPEIHSHLSLIECDSDQKLKYKESMPTFISQYIKDCRYVYSKISTNPFKMPRPINTALAMPQNVVNDMNRVFSLGVELYEKCKETRFVCGTEDVLNS